MPRDSLVPAQLGRRTAGADRGLRDPVVDGLLVPQGAPDIGITQHPRQVPQSWPAVLGEAMLDGGVPVSGSLTALDDTQLKSFEESFLR